MPHTLHDDGLVAGLIADRRRRIELIDEMAAALRWALDQIEDSLDPDHQAALAAAHQTLAKATGD
jgi:hypothetical protein